MKANPRRRKKSRIRAFHPPAGTSASEIIRELKRQKFFARVDKKGRIVTNAP